MVTYDDALTTAGRLLGITDPAADPALVAAVLSTERDDTYSGHLGAASYLDGIIAQAEIAAATGGVASFTSEGSSFTYRAGDLTGLRRLAARLRLAATGGVRVLNLDTIRDDEPPRSTYQTAGTHAPRPGQAPHVR